MARRQKGRDISGILVLDKPKGESSNKSLQRVKRLFDARKAGHTGSLDPLATGVLPLCFGEATKVSQFLLDSDKAYRTTICLGVKTASGDSEGEVLSKKTTDNISREQVERALEQFRGSIEQIPSMYSALKHNGVPLYKLARQGKTVERKARTISIYHLKLLSFFKDSDRCEIELDVECSKGTYIRSLADDLGDVLGVGGHVQSLRRIKAGPFALEKSMSYEELETHLEQGGFDSIDSLLIASDVAIQHLPKVSVPSTTAIFIKQGQAVIVRHLPTEGLVRIYEEGVFIGIGEILEDGRLSPKRLLNTNS